MAESIPKAKSAYAFFQAAMNKQMVGVPLGITPASHLDTVAAPSFEFRQGRRRTARTQQQSALLTQDTPTTAPKTKRPHTCCDL